MRDARYLRAQAEICLQIAGQMSNPKTAEGLRTEAAHHLAEARAIDEGGQQSSRIPDKPRN